MAGENNHFALVCVGGEPADLIRQRMDEALASVELSPRETEILSREEGPAAVETRLVLDNGAARDAASDVVEQLAVAFDTACLPLADRRKRLLICDMDSTIIQQECLDELADFAGLKAQVAAITQQAMNGEIDFAEALSNRVSLLKDMPVDRLERVWNERISLTPGARTLIQTMTRDGAHAVLVSGGFTFFTQRVARACGFHEHEANVLEVSDGVLTGRVVPPIRASAAKLAKLEALRTRRKLDARATMAIGDGANDLPMLQAAGLGVAYHGHARVNAGCPVQVRHGDLRTALYLQGYGDDEIIEVG